MRLTILTLLAVIISSSAYAADEVEIREYGAQVLVTQGNEKSDAAIGPLITTQIVDIGTLSAQFNSRTRYIIVCSKGTGFWARIGTSAVSAAADTNGNVWVRADRCDFESPVNFENHLTDYDYLDTAADS